MSRWTKKRLATHLGEEHPYGRNITEHSELVRWTLAELVAAHWRLHGFSEWGREGSPHQADQTHE